MKKIFYFIVLGGLFFTEAFAANEQDRFKAEVLEGLDLISVRENINSVPEAKGELGLDVYQTMDNVQNDGMQVFIPVSMYLRAGAGLNLGFATDKVEYYGKKYESSGSWTTIIGLGWNLSSFVRTEIDFQEYSFDFSDLDDVQASYQTIGGMLYFDFARRYVQTGDVTRKRKFVPFMGLGASFGQYKYDGNGGKNGAVITAPNAALGFNVMLNDLIGIDVMYQYQMMIGNGFGWGVNKKDLNNISNIIASFRVNF